ncbi:hypothetical protein JKP88DRAFT_245416 [Tribonema minus]|uniref:Uncharacterized protein n=1 Tax=Tribonema minus TaxID=303371 RepID=A0A836CGC9_9STRA|nr:hypothetical protein JKP88DRAFT_245416 [Tribonema minus]
MDSRARGKAYRLQYDATCNPAEAQQLVQQAQIRSQNRHLRERTSRFCTSNHGDLLCGTALYTHAVCRQSRGRRHPARLCGMAPARAVLYAGDAVPSTVKLREDGWCNLSDLCDHRDSLHNPIWLEFNNVGLCQRLRSPIAVALPTVVAAAAIVMEERQRPRAPPFVLFKTHNKPFFDTLTSFLDDLGEVLSSVHVPCFDMRTTPRHLVYKKQIHNVGPRDYALRGVPVRERRRYCALLRSIWCTSCQVRRCKHGKRCSSCSKPTGSHRPARVWRRSCRAWLCRTQRLQQRVEQQQLRHRSVDATYLQHRAQCERQHTELQGLVAEMRRAIAAERCSLSELQRDKEAAVSRRHSVVQDLLLSSCILGLNNVKRRIKQHYHWLFNASCRKRILDDDSLQQILNWYGRGEQSNALASTADVLHC